jgi:hypothetical protein
LEAGFDSTGFAAGVEPSGVAGVPTGGVPTPAAGTGWPAGAG